MNGHQETQPDEVDGGGIGLIFQRRRHKSDQVDSPVTKRIRNGSGPPKNSPGSKRNSTASFEEIPSFGEAIKVFKKIDKKNKTQKLDQITNFSYQDIYGNTILDAAIEGISDSDLLVEVVDHLIKNGADPEPKNHLGYNAIQRTIWMNQPKLLEYFYGKNQSWFDVKVDEDGGNLAVLAVEKKCVKSLEAVLKLKPDLVNEKMKERFNGFTPLTYCLIQQKLLLEKLQDSEAEDNLRNILNQAKNPTTDLIGDDVNIKAMVDLMLETCDLSTYLMDSTPFGSVLHLLIRLNYEAGILILLKRLDSGNKVLLRRIFAIKIGENKEAKVKLSPLFMALQRNVNKFKIAQLLLDYGADANEFIEVQERAWVLHRLSSVESGTTTSGTDHVDMSPHGSIISTIKTMSTIEYVLSKSNSRQYAYDVMDKLLSKMKRPNVKKAIKHVFDDSNLEFDLMKLFLEHADKKQGDSEAEDLNFSMKELINQKDKTTHQTALHVLMRSNQTSDIQKDLEYLIEKGGDILIQGKPLVSENGDNNSDSTDTIEYELPVHIATELQTTADEKDIAYYGYGKNRLAQYLTVLNKIGIPKLLKDKSMSYKIDFVKHHLIPGVYCVNHEFVHKIMTEFYKLNLENQFQILHHKNHLYRSKDLKDPKSVLYWATKQRQQNIMTDIVRAVYEVHKMTPSEKTKGMDCFHELPSTYLKTEAIRMYCDMSEPEPSCINNFFMAMFAILFMCYGTFFIDLFLDFDLIRTYQQEKNKTLQKLEVKNLSESEKEKIIDHAGDYQTATWISGFLVLPSLVAYLALAWTQFSVPTRFLIFENKFWKFFVTLFNPVTYPGFYFARYINTKTNPKSLGKADRYEECNRIWQILRRIEIGLEGTGQLLVQLWLLAELGHIPTIDQWFINGDIFQHLWPGLGYIITLGFIQAKFLEQMVAKFLFSLVGACAIITFIRTSKNSYSTPSIMARLLFFLSCVAQMFARIFTFRLMFLIDMGNSYKLLVVILHVLIEFFLIKVCFEWPPHTSKMKDKIQMVFRAITSSCAGLLVYLNINRTDFALEEESNNIKNTFLPTLLHFILCFTEHLVVIWFPSNGNVPPETADIYKILPFFLLIFAGAIHTFYYYQCHPLSLIKGTGPNFNHYVDEDTHYKIFMENLACCKLRIISYPTYKKPNHEKQNGHVVENVEEAELQQLNHAV